MVVNSNYKALSAVDNLGFNKICSVGLNLDDYVGSFDIKLLGMLLARRG